MKQIQIRMTIALSVLVAGLSCFGAAATGQQQPSPHQLSHIKMAPGDIAFNALIANPQWVAQIQPVRIRIPDNAQVSLWNSADFSPSDNHEPVIGLSVGPVARFKVNFPVPGTELEVYPTIELIHRLNPPPGLEIRFPVEVVLTQDDLVQASRGRLVTRVVYLENPETTLPYRQRAGEQDSFDVGEQEDPLAAASRLGRPIAIVRLGSRVPTPEEMNSAFHSGGAPIQEFPQQFLEEIGFRPRSPGSVRMASWQDGAEAVPFTPREGQIVEGPTSFPMSIANPMTAPGMQGENCDPGQFRFSVPAQRDEFLFDGDDRNFEVMVDQNWNLYGLDTEDTVGHFDTLDGRRLVVPSNRVAIYSPRFATVRRVDDFGHSSGTAKVSQFRDKDQLQSTSGKDFSSTTMQQLMPGLNRGTNRATGIIDRTRGVLSDQVVLLKGLRNGLSPYADLQMIRFGKLATSETSRLELGMQSAGVWEINDGLQVIADRTQPVIVNDPVAVQELLTVKVGDGESLLRVVKIASKIAAEPGEDVEFTIRFDNIGQQTIGNVTIIDSLTPRLEYVPDSSDCTFEASFLTERNEGQSLVLRWEIKEPIKAGQGGIIRFTCRVH